MNVTNNKLISIGKPQYSEFIGVISVLKIYNRSVIITITIVGNNRARINLCWFDSRSFSRYKLINEITGRLLINIELMILIELLNNDFLIL